MRIFVDESGSFARSERRSPCVVGALIVPDEKWDKLTEKYAALRRQLPKDKRGEVKGKDLKEAQVAKVVDLLRRNSVVFEATVAEMSLHEPSAVAAHRDRMAVALTANLTPEHHPDLVAQVMEYRQQLATMKVPEYVQSVVTLDLLHRVLDHSTMYFAQRIPRELGRFEWVIDAKGATDKQARWETWWRHILLPALQTSSFQRPGGRLPGGDYSHFERFCFDEIPMHLRDKLPERDNRAGLHINLSKVFYETTRFSPHPEPGLELVDIITNAVRRALVGHLGEEGWGRIPELMIHRSEHYLSFVHVADGEVPKGQFGYENVVRRFRRDGRTMITKRAFPDEA